jgi:hypothetical protein
VAVNHLRERVNMTHVILSIPAILVAVLFVGIPLNRILGGTRSALQRMAIALISVPATVILAVALFTFNALSAFCRLDVAGLIKHSQQLWRCNSWFPKAHKFGKAGLFRTSLRHHGVLQCSCSLLDQHAFCFYPTLGPQTAGRNRRGGCSKK